MKRPQCFRFGVHFRPALCKRIALTGCLFFVSPLLAADNKTAPPEALYYADAYADHYHVPRELVHAVIRAESGWNRKAVSKAHALGVMQLMPSTAQRYGVVDPFSFSDNIGGGVHYLADLINQFGDYRLAIAAYNCGEGRIGRRGLEYSSREVAGYVNTVRKYYMEDLAMHGGELNEQNIAR